MGHYNLKVYFDYEDIMMVCFLRISSNFFKGMTKVKVGKEDSSSTEFVEKRRAALER